MEQQEREGLIWLSAVSGIGTRTLWKITSQLELAELTLDEMIRKNTYNQLQLSESQIHALHHFRRQFSPADYTELLVEKKIDTLCWSDPNYPALLREVPNHPVVLYYQGPSDFWQALPIAVVGTRHLTPYGEQATKIITRQLVQLGATIISGYMYGADKVAHQTTLAEGGKTVGVLGYGFDFLVDTDSQCPLQAFLESGNTFITEYAPFLPAQKAHFPMRNRVVAGLSHATVVTEAAQRSGSLITANWAVEYNRLVCAVPGPLTSIYSEGTKQLINQGARLVTSGLEIVEELFPSLSENETNIKLKKIKKVQQTEGKIDYIDQNIVDFLKSMESTVDDVAERFELSISETITHLSLLEVQDLVTRNGDKWGSYS